MKKKVPFDLLKNIELIFNNNKDVIIAKINTDAYYYFQDIDNSSEFRYEIVKNLKRYTSYNPNYFYVECFPKDKNFLKTSLKSFKTPDEVAAHFQNWVDTIRIFNEANSLYDDPFIKKYQSEFFEKYKIVDEDADISPFSITQQEAIENYLNSIQQKLLDYKTEDKVEQEIIVEIISSIKDINDEIPISTKNKVFKRITTIWAKVYKWNKKIAKDIINIAKQELIKELIRKGIKYLPDVIDAAKLSN